MRLHREEIFVEAAPRGTWVGLVLGLWLTGVFVTSLGGWLDHSRGSTTSLVPLGIAVIWPLGYFAVSRCRFVPAPLSFGATCALSSFIMISALSSLMSPIPLLSMGYVVLTCAGIWMALQFNSNLTGEQYERGLKVFAVCMTGILMGFAWYDYVPGTRLGNGKEILNPNTIALVSTSVLLAATVFRTWLIRLALMVPIAVIIVLTSSRAAAVAAVAGLAMIVWLRLRENRQTLLALAGIGLLLTVGVAVAYGDLLYNTLDRFYDLSRADRGIGSGATGRTTAWKMTWELFLRNPVLGVGFRAHEQVLNVGSSAHNGYLATLAEVGIIGFLAVAFLVVRGFRLLWVRSEDPERMFGSSVLLGVAVAYLLLAVFERYLINVGNPTSLLFLLSIMRPDISEMDRVRDDEPWQISEEEVTGEFAQGELRT